MLKIIFCNYQDTKYEKLRTFTKPLALLGGWGLYVRFGKCLSSNQEGYNPRPLHYSAKYRSLSLTYLRGLEVKQLDVEDLPEL